MTLTLDDIKRLKLDHEIEGESVFDIYSGITIINVTMTPQKWLAILDLAEKGLKESND